MRVTYGGSHLFCSNYTNFKNLIYKSTVYEKTKKNHNGK